MRASALVRVCRRFQEENGALALRPELPKIRAPAQTNALPRRPDRTQPELARKRPRQVVWIPRQRRGALLSKRVLADQLAGHGDAITAAIDMQIQCPNCGEVVPADNVHLDRMVAKCRACSAVFAISVPGQAHAEPDGGRPRAHVAQPSDVSVAEYGRELAITRDHRSGCGFLFLLGFATVWNSLAWALYFGVPAELWYIRWFLAIFQLVGFFLAYLTIASLVNKVTITVNPDMLSLRHHPLPFPGNVQIESACIVQLFVRERISRSSSSRSSSISVYYSVEARLEDGTRKKVLANLRDPDEALWYERTIEEWLGIADREVRGEI